ncbi:MAG: hypothetical protein EOM26_12180 [Alphaproteobacteria bacterium]|nr:hypothetical protein [Alphaproteobacteria bacterium]
MKNEAPDYPDYMDVKEASEVVDELRGRTMHMIWQYKAWRQRRSAVLMKSEHLLMEDDLLRTQINETFRLYKVVQGEYTHLHRRCLEGLRQKTATRFVPEEERKQCA